MRRPATRVEPGQLPGFRLPDNGKQIAADAAIHRLHDAEDGIRGNRGVHGRAASRKNLGPGLRGKRLTGRDDASPRDDHRARLGAVERVVADLGK